MRSSFRHYVIVYGRFRSVKTTMPLFVRPNAARIALHECPKSLPIVYLHFRPHQRRWKRWLRARRLSRTKGVDSSSARRCRLDTIPADRSASSGTTHKTCYAVIVRSIARGIVCRFVRKTCFPLGNLRMEEEFIGNVWKFMTAGFSF